MKIAFFSKCLPSDQPNGVSVQVHRLAQALSSSGHEVTVFSFSPKPPDALYNCNQLETHAGSAVFAKLMPAIIFSRIDISNFDVAHYHGDDYLCKGSRKRVRTFYGSAFHEALHSATAGRFFYQSLFYMFEWISCLKRGKLAAISRTTGKALPVVKRIIPCGVPLSIYKPAELKTTHPSILFIGDFRSRKRGDLLLKTFTDEILPAFPHCTLTVVGPRPISGRNIIYAGRVSENELVDLYRKSWIYCLPSSYEGFGVPAIEAMACGTAVLATVNRGVVEFIENGKNGLLCTSKLLGKYLLMLISDQDRRNKLITEGLSHVKKFDIFSICRQYEFLYEDILNSRFDRKKVL